MADQATIATDILARYAADAAREVDGVRAISGRRGVRISGKGASRIELHLVAELGVPAILVPRPFEGGLSPSAVTVFQWRLFWW